jgi:hypothetical protein
VAGELIGDLLQQMRFAGASGSGYPAYLPVQAPQRSQTSVSRDHGAPIRQARSPEARISHTVLPLRRRTASARADRTRSFELMHQAAELTVYPLPTRYHR